MTYQGPERRRPDPTVLAAVVESIDRLTERLETNLSEERLTSIVANEQKRDRIKILAAVIGPVLVAAIVSAFGLAQSRANHDQNKKIIGLSQDASTSAQYVKVCLQKKTDGLSAEQITAECGDVLNQSSFFITYLNCVFPLPVDQRTQAKLDACVTKAVAAASPPKQ
jgi:predicted Mrr-cat superfamily restriction endonuclease